MFLPRASERGDNTVTGGDSTGGGSVTNYLYGDAYQTTSVVSDGDDTIIAGHQSFGRECSELHVGRYTKYPNRTVWSRHLCVRWGYGWNSKLHRGFSAAVR